jgi:translation initiation factor 5A
VSYSTAKTGKHGAAKAMFTGIDIFTSNKIECTYSTGDNVDSPIVKRIEYTLTLIDEEDGYIHLMAEDGEVREDMKLPEDEWLKEVADRIKAGYADEKELVVTVLSALGIDKVTAVREAKP